jgi:hypothetical protein
VIGDENVIESEVEVASTAKTHSADFSRLARAEGEGRGVGAPEPNPDTDKEENSVELTVEDL